MADIDFELLDAFRRLVSLLDHPETAELFCPAILTEIHFLILAGGFGSALRLFRAICLLFSL